MVQWRVHGERFVYESPWVSLALSTVEPPGLEPFEHHVVRSPGPAAGCIVTRTATAEHDERSDVVERDISDSDISDSDIADSDGPDGGIEVLLLFRHRFITDTWGWEIPAGGVDRGETPAAAAARETREETGWELTRPPEPVTVFHPSNGLSDQTFHIFHADGARHVGDPSDPTEASRIEWRSVSDVRSLIAGGRITDGLSLTGLAVAFTLGVFGAP